MARAKRTPEQNRAIYQRRKQRAITEGYKGYGQKRYQETKRKKKVPGWSGGILDATPIGDLPLTEDRQRAYDRLVESKRFTAAELDRLRHAPKGDFWPIYRTLYNKLIG